MDAMKKEDEIFLTTKQAAKKLEIALQRYFELLPQEEELKKRYGNYLFLRLRPAAQELIRQGENRKLEQLLEELQPEPAVLDQFLDTALSCKNQEAQMLLLRRKKTGKGFHEKNWEL